jgi:hypothetical protein
MQLPAGVGCHFGRCLLALLPLSEQGAFHCYVVCLIFFVFTWGSGILLAGHTCLLDFIVVLLAALALDVTILSMISGTNRF